MKKWLVITLMMLGITACGEPEDPNAPTQAEKRYPNTCFHQ